MAARLRTCTLAVDIAVIAAGCGGGGKPTDARQQVADAAKRFEYPAIHHDGAAYCALLTDSERSHVLRQVSRSVGPAGAGSR